MCVCTCVHIYIHTCMQVHTYTNILIDVYINPKRKQYHPSFSLDLHTLQACNRRHACARARPYRACAWTAGTAGRSGHIWSVTRRSTRTCPAAPARPRRWAAPPWRPPSRPRTGSDQGSGQTVSPQRAAPSSLRQAPLPRAARPPRCRERAAPLSLGQPCHDGLRHELVYAPAPRVHPPCAAATERGCWRWCWCCAGHRSRRAPACRSGLRRTSTCPRPRSSPSRRTGRPTCSSCRRAGRRSGRA